MSKSRKFEGHTKPSGGYSCIIFRGGVIVGQLAIHKDYEAATSA
jgi:hypothetical protein